MTHRGKFKKVDIGRWRAAPYADAFDAASRAELKPNQLENTMAFMFETRFAQRVSAYAAAAPELQQGYGGYGHALRIHFDPTKK